MATARELLLCAIVAGVGIAPSAGFAGGTPSGDAGGAAEVSKMGPAITKAVTDGTGDAPVAVDLVYSLQSGDAGPGPVFAVYAHLPDTADAPSERVLLGHVAAFHPPGPDGLNAATVQVPPDLAGAFKAGDLLIELEHFAPDEDTRSLLAARSPVTLESATVVTVE